MRLLPGLSLPLPALLVLLAGGCGSAAHGPGTGAAYVAAMAREHAGHTPEASAPAAVRPRQEVVGEEVVYGTVDGKPLRGYLARPAGARDELPAVVVIHEWWGLNDPTRATARRLAGEGYAVLAVDMFGGEVASTPERARELTTASLEDHAGGGRNLRTAAEYLREQGAPRVGVVGWCFGGAWSLQAALSMPERVDAAVVYYGQPVTDRTELARLSAPLLGLFGGADRGIPLTQVRRMEATLRELGKDAEIVVYRGAGHAFANPSGQAYHARAAQDAWNRTVAFLAEHLKDD